MRPLAVPVGAGDFDRPAILAGEWWRLLTGHLTAERARNSSGNPAPS